jgi:phage terminase large subunit GpA-like protein
MVQSLNSPSKFEPDYTEGLAAIKQAIANVWAPRKPQKVVDWAFDNIRLPNKAAAEPGPLDFQRTPYAIGIANEIENPRNNAVVWVAGAQVAKTTLLVSCALKKVCTEQSPALMVLSTISLAEGFSKERLAPIIRTSPTLSAEFGDSKSKDSSNTILYKEGKGGGHLVLIGSNSSAEMRSRPVRDLYLDEVSSYSENKEGDVVELLKQRQVTFFDRTTVLCSTPLFKGDRIESEYLKTDQRKFYVECPHCHEWDWLKWRQVKWDKDQPETARYHCEHCEEEWAEYQRRRAISAGEWKATATPAPGFESTPGFHLSALYSPWLTLAQLATQWMDAQGDRLKLQSFINTKLAEGYEVSEYNDIDPVKIQGRAENYAPGTVPMGGLLLTAGVDVQKDRLVVSVYAWGEGEEAWLIAYLNLYGNPLLEPDMEGSPWPQLDALMDADYIHESGTPLKITLTNVDSGFATQDVYQYVRTRERRFRVRAINGLPGDREIVNPPTYPKIKGHEGTRNKDGLKLWGIGVNRAKKVVYSRINLVAEGARYIHFPRKMPLQFFEELTGEQITIKYKNGFPYEVWELKPGRQNHALDCLVYALAAAYHLRIDEPQYPWETLRKQILSEPLEVEEAQSPQQKRPKTKRNKFTGKPQGGYFGKQKPTNRRSRKSLG